MLLWAKFCRVLIPLLHNIFKNVVIDARMKWQLDLRMVVFEIRSYDRGGATVEAVFLVYLGFRHISLNKHILSSQSNTLALATDVRTKYMCIPSLMMEAKT